MCLTDCSLMGKSFASMSCHKINVLYARYSSVAPSICDAPRYLTLQMQDRGQFVSNVFINESVGRQRLPDYSSLKFRWSIAQYEG